MKILFSILMLLSFSTSLIAQEIIKVPHEKSNNVVWNTKENQYYSNIWDTQVVTNVNSPTMQVFKPTTSNGTAVIIAPGGGLYGLSIESEGNMVAKWLSERGVTAFVLKYRLVPTGNDGVQEITDEGTNNPAKIGERIKPVLPLSIADGLSAVAYVREHANDYNVDPSKIGFMGFSAGGAVTMGVGYYSKILDRPDFIVPVYPWTSAFPVQEAPKNAPKMLVVCATDDPLGLAKGSIELYTSWLKTGNTPALHMYSQGGHGFGMKTQGLPSDSWIERFYDWAKAEKIIEKVSKG
ncbi:alpha/beta hydrolase [Cytophaga sp. FL35]|uniref:alpha/beta hydrolase n=1 Tax=Cytophaga sp. FL35 TaxID=1904456 RepID=UPI0016534C30|nr:alpha/beta hydrolase [Cytophaga sp. FL35]MBC6998826.1 alpha/beta hydrolase [Cytophaga sp. FL35]